MTRKFIRRFFLPLLGLLLFMQFARAQPAPKPIKDLKPRKPEAETGA